MARFSLASIVFAFFTLSSALFANAAPALSQADAKTAIEHTRPGATFSWRTLQFGEQRAATVAEASRLGMPYPTTVHLVYAQFTADVSGNRRDVKSNYYIFQDYSGHWHAETNAIPGNEESNPY